MYIFLIILLLILPWPLYWWYMSIFRSTRKNRINLVITKTLDRVVRKNRLSVNEMDLFDNKIIGLDQRKYKLILIEYENMTTRADCISLNQVTSCNLYKEMNESTGRVEKVRVSMTIMGGSDPVNFIFYDATKQNVYELPFLSGKAKYWKSRIQLYIHNTRPEPEPEYTL
ncbi:MAG: hypothetical protein ABUT20_16975 [Bacteroidota bacterium]